jgi:thiamine pyrophosphokinase
MRALVFAGGDGLDPRFRADLPPGAPVIAADSGLDLAQRLGFRAELVVGDLDSVSAQALRRAQADGTRVERHPADKDRTDLDLALSAAARRGATEVTVVGAGGGRLDHLLANLAAGCAPEHAGLEIEVLAGPARVVVVRRRAALRGEIGSLLSLLALAGPADGVRTTGLRWPLRGERLPPGSTRGISNELVERVATVTVASGTVLAVQPHGGALP